MNGVELLAPAGSYDAARAAVNAGADAIYMGGPLFSARAYAESSAEEMLLKSIRYAHIRGVKVYMTLNTLMKENEFRGLLEYLTPYVNAGLDAVIVQDLGLLPFLAETFPKLSVHGSTQMTITGKRHAAWLKAVGVSRIVLPRELSLSETREIYEATGMEIESFVHGALCYAYSGQCLMSSMIGGRSGNRGRCAGPCRLPYELYDGQGRRLSQKDRGYLLSMKDLRTLSDLPRMIEAGVCSMKIEGRMKSPLYVAAVVEIYRKYLDRALSMEDRSKLLPVEEADLALLSEVFDRGGCTNRYLYAQNGQEMLALTEKPEYRKVDEERLAGLKERYLDEDKRIPVEAEAVFRIGEPARLKASAAVGTKVYTAETESVYPDRTVLTEAAAGRPVESSQIREKLGKLGGTDFVLSELSLTAEERIFFPLRELNELRRKTIDELTAKILKGGSRDEGAV